MKRLSLIAILGLLASPSLAQSEKDADKAGNLFLGHANVSPFVDRIARHQGDILTVVVTEISSSNYTASTSLSKSDSNQLTNGIPVLQGLFSAASTGAKSSNAGSGTSSAVGNLTAQLSVTIKQILPNGNFVIEGTRSIKTNKDTQTFKLTGIVRPDDIRSDNTVLSPAVTDFKIEVDGKGAIADRQRRGILTRLVDWLF